MIDSVLILVIFSPADLSLPPGVLPTSSGVLVLAALDSMVYIVSSGAIKSEISLLF